MHLNQKQEVYIQKIANIDRGLPLTGIILFM